MVRASFESPSQKPHLRAIGLLFFRLGATAFGGPAVHIAMMEEEIVRRRSWLSQSDFLDLLGATAMIPGPNSTEMALHVGHRLAGWRGLLTAGAAFITPAFVLVWIIAWFYVRYGALPALQGVFLGIQPVLLAVIGHAVWSLSRSAIKNRALAVLSLVALGLYLVSGNELLVLFLIALINLALKWGWSKGRIPPYPQALLIATLLALSQRALARINGLSPAVSLDQLFWYFAKIGSVLFGSGYVLVAFLQSDVVERYQWISQQQLMDAIAVGQFTPGPVFTTATFIGFLIAGHLGAMVATFGIFVPSFFLVVLSAPVIPRMRKSLWAAPILDGLNVASLSLMAGAALQLGRNLSPSPYGVGVFLISLVLLIRFKINSLWLILATGLLAVLGLTP